MGPCGGLAQLLRPSALRAEQARLLYAAMGGPEAPAMALSEPLRSARLALPATEVATAQRRVDAFVEDVCGRMERGSLKIYVREKGLVFFMCSSFPLCF